MTGSKRAVGSSTGTRSTSDVVFEALVTTIDFSSKLMPTPTKNRSSGSFQASASSTTGVPTRWRHTVHGRQAASSFV